MVKLGGTLNDLYLWDTGYYPRNFMAKVMAFGKLNQLIEMHVEDAKSKAIKSMERHRKQG